MFEPQNRKNDLKIDFQKKKYGPLQKVKKKWVPDFFFENSIFSRVFVELKKSQTNESKHLYVFFF